MAFCRTKSFTWDIIIASFIFVIKNVQISGAEHVYTFVFRLLSNLQEWSHIISKTLSRLTTCVVISEEDDITTIPPSIMEDLVYQESEYTDDE